MKLLIFSLVTITLFFFHYSASGDEPKYAVANIPAELLKDANAVVRNYEMSMDIVSASEVNIVEKYTITILNKDGYNFARIYDYCNSFTDVTDITGTLYDKNGREIRSIRKSDIQLLAPYREYVHFDDLKVKYYDFNYSDYPFTIYIETQKTQKESLRLPSFRPRKNIHCAIEKAELQVSYPKNISLRYKAFCMKEQPVVSTVGNVKKITAHITGISAEKDVEMTDEDEYNTPSVILASDNFEYAGIKGNMDTWKSFGKFVYDLNSNRNDLSDEIKKIVHKLTDTCSGDVSKINVLYKYLQKNTRYVAIETGISGIQCIDATTVATNEFGDCKGLSNFMCAMLKEAGIFSCGALIYGGHDNRLKAQEGFPYNAFNHYILCVPRKSDTIWMDCTSKTEPAGYLSSFTSNRYALLLMPDGGYLVRTPGYSMKENTTSRNAQIYINNDELQAAFQLNYSGHLCDVEKSHVIDRTKQKTEDHFINMLSSSGYTITDYKISQNDTAHIPRLHEEFTVKGPCNIMHTGKRLFINQLVTPLHIPVPSSATARTTPFHIAHSTELCDTQTIHFNVAFTGESIPQDINYNYSFCSYSCKTLIEDGNILKIIRRYQQTEGVYPPEMFNDYLTVTKAINSKQIQTVLLKKD